MKIMCTVKRLNEKQQFCLLMMLEGMKLFTEKKRTEITLHPQKCIPDEPHPPTSAENPLGRHA